MKITKKPYIDANKLKIITFFIIFVHFYITNVHAQTFNGFNVNNSIIPHSEIYSGGPPKDGIPALTDPKFENISATKWLDDDSRVLGISKNGIAKAYPLKIMNWHEIVNDQFGSDYIMISYCPLCFSGMAFKAQINGKRHIFGVSGLLYNSDVLLFDRNTESLWSQIMSRGVAGEYVNAELELVPLENTSWLDWRTKHPDTLVLSRDTGYTRDYSRDPYKNYRQSPETIFPVKFRSKGYHPKEIVIGITIDNHAKAYPFIELSKSENKIFSDIVANKTVLIEFNSNEQSARIFDANCEPLPATTLYWFAWYTFHPHTEIYKTPHKNQHSDTSSCAESRRQDAENVSHVCQYVNKSNADNVNNCKQNK